MTETTPVIEIQFDAWKMRDFISFMAAAEKNDFQGMMKGIAKVVKSWQYEGDPSDPESYLDLTVAQWVEVSRAVSAGMAKGFAQGN